MIYRPIYISCDMCQKERKPTPKKSRETIKEAIDAAKNEGWYAPKKTLGISTYCPSCAILFKKNGHKDINFVDYERFEQYKVVKTKVVPVE